MKLENLRAPRSVLALLPILMLASCEVITRPDRSQIGTGSNTNGTKAHPSSPSSKPATGSDGGTGSETAGTDTGGTDSTSDDSVPYKDWPFNAKEAKRRQQETADDLGLDVEFELELSTDVTMKFELIPAGMAELGSPDGTPGAEADEMLRSVAIHDPFYIGKYQLRRDEYNALMGEFPENDPYSFVKMTDSLSEPSLTRYEAVRDLVMPKLQKRVPKGWKVRLPTEDEWEYATRAGTATLFYTGDSETDLAEIAWYSANSDHLLHDVGKLKPNAWGLYDMLGNSWHWVYRKDGWYNDADPKDHIVRGCDCDSDAFANGCRTSNYMIQSVAVGYRFALDPK
ncbi:MAG TPA: SUMF1/EgtB/PvdO family nonheme iron enzyme [Polyangiaceae bacterium]|jgi:hypothetical protein|nr:SUMF1/EgtB/PvdO family nonheme iron enzyme [Polyangiaceae bacterium]